MCMRRKNVPELAPLAVSVSGGADPGHLRANRAARNWPPWMQRGHVQMPDAWIL